MVYRLRMNKIVFLCAKVQNPKPCHPSTLHSHCCVYCVYWHYLPTPPATTLLEAYHHHHCHLVRSTQCWPHAQAPARSLNHDPRTHSTHPCPCTTPSSSSLPSATCWSGQCTCWTGTRSHHSPSMLKQLNLLNRTSLSSYQQIYT